MVEKGKEKYFYNTILIIFLGGREDEDKRKQKNNQTWIFSKTALLWHMVIPLGPRLGYT